MKKLNQRIQEIRKLSQDLDTEVYSLQEDYGEDFFAVKMDDTAGDDTPDVFIAEHFRIPEELAVVLIGIGEEEYAYVPLSRVIRLMEPHNLELLAKMVAVEIQKNGNRENSADALD